jgi:hypothetical protein
MITRRNIVTATIVLTSRATLILAVSLAMLLAAIPAQAARFFSNRGQSTKGGLLMLRTAQVLGFAALAPMVFVFGMVGGASASIIVQDETDGRFNLNQGWGIGDGLLTGTPEPAGANNLYLVNYPTQTDGYWTPGLDGTYLVEASWATNSNHSPDVDYYFRSDGTSGSAVITLAEGINQHYLNDQATTASLTWSGYYELGTFDLTTASTFHIDQITGNTSTCLWQFTEVPEPSTLVLLCMAAFGFLTYTRRRR